MIQAHLSQTPLSGGLRFPYLLPQCGDGGEAKGLAKKLNLQAGKVTRNASKAGSSARDFCRLQSRLRAFVSHSCPSKPLSSPLPASRTFHTPGLSASTTLWMYTAPSSFFPPNFSSLSPSHITTARNSCFSLPTHHFQPPSSSKVSSSMGKTKLPKGNEEQPGPALHAPGDASAGIHPKLINKPTNQPRGAAKGSKTPRLFLHYSVTSRREQLSAGSWLNHQLPNAACNEYRCLGIASCELRNKGSESSSAISRMVADKSNQQSSSESTPGKV